MQSLPALDPARECLEETLLSQKFLWLPVAVQEAVIDCKNKQVCLRIAQGQTEMCVQTCAQCRGSHLGLNETCMWKRAFIMQETDSMIRIA